MSKDLKPGLYKATVRGVPDVTVMVDDDGLAGHTGEFLSASNGTNYRAHLATEITDARPLIVLDIQYPAALVKAMREGVQRLVDSVADQIEAQTKPARIPEPGLWGVVEASYNDGARCHWTLGPDGLWHSVRPNVNTCGVTVVAWDLLIDPTLIREGVN